MGKGGLLLLFLLAVGYISVFNLTINASDNSANNDAKPFVIPEDLPSDLVYHHDLPIGKGGERIMKLDLVCPKNPPARPLPALVYIHGGGWNHGSKNDHARKIIGYAKDGYIGVSIEYRLTHEAIFPAQLEDCKLAIRFLRANAEKYHINPDKIGVWGSSAGGHLAALLGTTGGIKELEGNGGWPDFSSRVQAVCDCSGPVDFINEYADRYSSVTKLLGINALADPERARRAMPGTYASPDDPPFLIIHGTKDTTVPFENSRLFYEDLKRAGVRVSFLPVEGAGHSFSDYPQVTAAAKEFFEKLLKND